MVVCGIYKITCKNTGKLYVGSSVDIETRWRGHKSCLNRNKHCNRYLQRAWNKYGENNFKFEILEIIQPDLLIENELKWFETTNCLNKKFGFNVFSDPSNPKYGKRKTTFKIRKQKTPKIKQKSEQIISFENASVASKETFRAYAKGNSHELDDSEIIRLYIEDKRSCRDISILGNCSESRIYKILLGNNIKPRDKSEANKLVSDNILIKLYNLGLSFSQIGILVGINPTTISKRFSLIGFPTRLLCQAKGIGYTKEEFKRFFMNNKSFISLIKEVI